jgi:lipoprotein-anchoring transpeptidase ErfK/SrfK
MQPRRYSHADVTQPVRVRGAVQPRAIPQPQPKINRPAVLPPAPQRMPPTARLPQSRGVVKAKPGKGRPLLWAVAGFAVLVMMSCAAVTMGVGLIYASGILPGVRAAGMAVGSMSQADAAQRLQAEWQTITVRDGQRAWEIDPATLGIALNAGATAQQAYDAGRGDLFNMLPGIIGRVDIEPVVNVDAATAQAGLQEMTSQFEQPPVNAGVRLVNGQIETTPPIQGRVLDIMATVAQLQRDAGGVLADGMLELVMQSVQPSVTDSTPMVAQAAQLLSRPLDIRVYDPVTGDSVYWSVAPEEWGNWLTATPDSSSSTGLALTANSTRVRDYLSARAGSVFDASRYLSMDESVANVQNSIAGGNTTPTVRAYHHDRQHVVQPGETIISIAWDYGVPYLYIVEANGGVDNVSVGQTITIPSEDDFLPYPPVPDKRIVVSISEQRTRVYENGALKWDWLTSTGISDSPTWPGVYQIISHEPNAYAGNWNLWMPQFMGVYQPIPGSDFTNGFHGFPTRGNSQLLWTNDLGTRVTYGCILLSNENAQLLYDWAEQGVVVEITA